MDKKFIITALAVAAVVFVVTPFLWPFDAEHAPPESLALLFQGVGVLSSLAFGIGVAFLLFGYRKMRTVESGFGLTFWSFISVVWLLVSWWPHENLHRVYEGDYHTLIALEYGFHVTLYIAGVLLALYLLRSFRRLSV